MDSDTTLADQLRKALAHIDDPAYLETLELAGRVAPDDNAPELSRGQLLRRYLRKAIASLDPGLHSQDEKLEARCYQVLFRYYIGKQSMVAIGSELGISSRQCYRELRRAVSALTHVMSGMVNTQTALAPRDQALKEQLQRLGSPQGQDIDVDLVLRGVVASAKQLAQQSEAEITYACKTHGLQVRSNRVMLRQALLNLLVHFVAEHDSARIAVELEQKNRHALLSISRIGKEIGTSLGSTSPYAIGTALLDSLSLHWTDQRSLSGNAALQILLPIARASAVLVVDDNPDVIRLFRRYLRDYAYSLHGASGFSEALDMFAQLDPDVTIIDVMMADRDGWELLQRLRASDNAKDAKIVVCSIIEDPGLATALGADAFLQKPVSRGTLIQTLEELLASAV